jgi:predicted dehydrogenase
MGNDLFKVLLVAIGGYGGNYANELLDNRDKGVTIAGVVDPKPEGYRRFDEIMHMGIPVFQNIEEFFVKNTADLAVISSPIHFHCSQTMAALENGCSVLCEKPMCATVQEGIEIIGAKDRAKKAVAIGYQWSFSDAVQQLKADIISGDLGKPVRLKTMVLWPRTHKYFGRNDWAGKMKDKSGRWILDSVANNATAHYLHNMFYVLGNEMTKSARPVSVTAELYKANNIENFDTSAIKCKTDNNAEIIFIASHAVDSIDGPVFCYEFEAATVMFDGNKECEITAFFKNGRKKSYGNPDKNGSKKLWNTVDSVKNGKSVACPPEAALSHTICINGSQESSQVNEVPPCMIKERYYPPGGSVMTYAEGLAGILKECYDNWQLPYDMGISWARPGRLIDLRCYKVFQGETK